MVDSEWAILHGRNELAEQFLSQNTSRFHYVDNFGASHQFFTATNHEYLDQDRNLKALFSAYTDKNKNEINKFLHSIQIQNRNASTDFRRGMEQGYKDSSNDAHNDPKIIGKGIISLPRYVYDSSTSDEVGPLDDQQMETNRIALLRLQGRDYDAGRIYEYNHATRQRLMWYQLPVMELAGRIPSKLANKYKLYREGKLSAAQLAAEIKKQAPVVPNGKAFDFTSGALIPNQTVKLTQAQNLSNGTTLPAGTIARLTGKGVEATLPNGKNVSYAGVTEQRALPKPIYMKALPAPIAVNASNTPPVTSIPPVVQSRINLKNRNSNNSGWFHVVDRHLPEGGGTGSQFSIPKSELRELLQHKDIVSVPITQTRISIERLSDGSRISHTIYERVIRVNKDIGYDKYNNNMPTNIMTIQTDKYGNLITTTPGRMQ